MTLTLTDNCVNRIKTLQAQNNSPGLKLRIIVDSGGCQGFEYRFDLTDRTDDADHIFMKDGAAVITDEVSLPYLQGAEIDFVDDLIGATFKINNPNASSSCGCGTSFSV
ncbi:MAG: iron-sulfur cluster insertion protein ErpA [Alphaproteobacteria bacterium]|jgi:iron-sulfur cluster assembly accessory protein|nr:iron-sulfur cluster insertion protein ErpA [Alphaproteobacteria bacterium]